MEKKIYYPELDIVKGIAILVVICAHCIADNLIIPQKLDFILHAFSMPLFMMASGFLFSFKDSWSSFLRKKVFRLVIPYIVFGLITIALRSVGGSIKRGEASLGDAFLGLLVGDYYWFLYALFIFMLVCRVFNEWYLLLAFAITSFIGAYFYFEPRVSFIVERLVVYPFYFILGIGFKRVYAYYSKYVRKKPFLYSILFTVLFVISISHTVQSYDDKHLAQLLGCLMCWTWSVYIVESRIAKLFSPIKHFGHYSLQYYLNHLCISLGPLYPLLLAVIPFPVVVLLICFALRTFLSWAALQIQLRIKCLKPFCGL